MLPRRFILITGAVLFTMALAWLLQPAGAETCLSPFVQRLDRPEKTLYIPLRKSDLVDLLCADPSRGLHGTNGT